MGRNTMLHHLVVADDPHLAVPARLGKGSIGTLHSN